MKALSIRQPWAWLIVHAGKDIENRCWRTHYRGCVLVHAAKGMTRNEYQEACLYATTRCGVKPEDFPAFDALERGGIIGHVVITGCVDESESPWFFGPYGFTLSNATPLPFTPCKGSLSFFTPERSEVTP